ncbi:MAG: hypothetical protein HY370_06485 [Proteobacteria bacterium]|nr:hypothetical protein [Pseudomonadota bacterium]
MNLSLLARAAFFTLGMTVAAEMSHAADPAAQPQQNAQEGCAEADPAWNQKTPRQKFDALVQRAQKTFDRALHPEKDPCFSTWIRDGFDEVAVSESNLQLFSFAAMEANKLLPNEIDKWNPEDFLSLSADQYNETMRVLLLKMASLSIRAVEALAATGQTGLDRIEAAEYYLKNRKQFYGAKESGWEQIGRDGESIKKMLIENHRLAAQNILDESLKNPDHLGPLGLYDIRTAAQHLTTAYALAGINSKEPWEDAGWTRDRIAQLYAKHQLATGRRNLDSARREFGVNFPHPQLSKEKRLTLIESAMTGIREASAADGIPVGWHRIFSTPREVETLVRELGGNPAAFRFNNGTAINPSPADQRSLSLP